MAIEFGVDPNFNGEESTFVNAPCHAHLVVVDADEDGLRLGGKNNNGSLVIQFEVVAATDPSQVGLHFKVFFTKTMELAWLIKRFALAAGMKDVNGVVYTAAYDKKLRDEGKGPKLDFESGALGLQVFADIDWEHYTDRQGNPGKSLKIQRKGVQGFYHLTSKQCTNEKSWPRHAGFISRAGVIMPKPAANDAASSPTGISGTTTAAKPQGQPLSGSRPPAAAALAGLSLG